VHHQTTIWTVGSLSTAMKSITQVATLLLSLMMATADERCQNLVNQCNMLKTTCSPAVLTIKSCCDLISFPLSIAPSSVYKIDLNCKDVCGDNFATQHVYCDMHTDNGGWTVIQRNRPGVETDFDRDWIDYEDGFGDLQNEFWYGLKKLHCLTRNGQWEMRVDYQPASISFRTYHYSNFSVGNATQEYPLMTGGFTGRGADLFSLLNMARFSTRDNENTSRSCARNYRAGWWYREGCSSSDVNLNLAAPNLGNFIVLEMKMRPKNCITSTVTTNAVP